MKFLVLLAPALVGAFLAMLAMLGLVASQTAAPDNNPASKVAITYGS